MADGSVNIDIKLDDAKAKAEASKAGKDISKNLESGLKGASTAAKNSEAQIKSAMSGAASSSKSAFSDVGSAAKSGFSNVGDAANSASSAAASAFQNVPATAAGAFADVGSQAKAGFDGVADAAKSAGEGASDAFKEVGNSIEDMAQSSIPHGSTITNILGTSIPAAAAIGAAAVMAIAAAFGSVAKEAVNVGMDFDKSFSQVAATMGTTTDQIGELRDFAQEMGATTAFSATQASDALNYMALAGYDAETSMRVLPTVLNLAAAGGMELATASDMVTDAQSALGLSVEQAETMVDQMAKTSSKTNTSVEQLGNAFLTVGGTAKNLQGGTAELAQMLGVLADNGIKGSEGGTALRNVILSLSAPTDTAAKKIEELGLQVFDAEGNMRAMPDIVNDLNSAMDGLTQQEKTEALNTIFNKVDLKSVNALLGTSATRFDEVAAAIDDAQGSAEAMANTQLDNLAGDVTLLQSATEGFYIGISDYLNPALRGIVQVAGEAFSNLTEIWKSAMDTGNFIGVGEAIGSAIIDVIDKVVEMVPEMITTFLEIVSGIFMGVVESIPSFLVSIVGALTQLIPMLIETAFKIIQSLIESLPIIIQEFIAAIPQIIQMVINALVVSIPLLIQGCIQLVLALVEALPQIIMALIEALPTIIISIVNALIDNLPLLVEGFIQLFMAFIQALPMIIANIIMALPQIITSIVQNIGTWGAQLKQSAIDAFNQFVEGVKQKATDIFNEVASIPDKILSALGNVGQLLWDAGTSIIDGFLGGLKAAWDNVTGFIGGIGDWIAEHKGPKEYDLKLLVPAGNWIIEGLQDGFEQAMPKLERTLNDITGRVESGFDIKVNADSWDNAIDTGEGIARGIVLGYEKVDPAGQMVASMGALMAMAASSNVTTNNTNNTWNINQPVQSPDEWARYMARIDHHGLAGSYV